MEWCKGSNASPASRRRHRAVDSIPSFHIRCPGIQLQTACAPWRGRGYFPTKRPSRAARRVRDCSCMCAQTRHPHGHSGHCRGKKHAVHNAHPTVVAIISQPCGILTAPPSSVAVRRRSHPLHPGPINAGRADRRPELRRDGCPPPLDRERDLACFKTSRHSFIFQTGCFTQMDLE